MTTFEFPPYFGNFASISPNVLVTDNLPGRTLYGPNIDSGSEEFEIVSILVL